VQRGFLIMIVFLRMLEYYNGVLFLTTNRVGVSKPSSPQWACLLDLEDCYGVSIRVSIIILMFRLLGA
jgi:hypothetical protein